MKAKLARELAKGLIVDIDGALASRETEDRHSAGMSAAILAVRLLAGACVNLARIAQAAEDIADKMYEETES